MDWHKAFVGRESDLKILQEAWDEARVGTPRVVAIVAESGFGKTRLAQEFYNWLSTVHDGVGGAGYWPDKLLREDDNLRVNPDPASCGGDTGAADMPFLWWGLRLPDPGQRNTTAARSAFAAGLDTLRPHLARLEREIERAALKRRQITGGGKTAGDVFLSVAETAADAFLGFATLGSGGILKTVGQAAWDHYKALQEQRTLDGLDVGPAAAAERARDELAEAALGDLFRVCKSPPGGLDAIPLIILVDDIQWLKTDSGTASFLDLLLARARAESWPLLLLLTSWEAEWKSTASARQAPGTLANVDAGDVVHYLGGVQGLERIVREAFSGLTAQQVHALVEKAEGTPRMLDEMLMYLARHRKAFEGRDLGAALTEGGLAEVLTREFAAFVADRLNEAPESVRLALAIASKQGIGFSPRLVHSIAERLALAGTQEGLREGEDPHSFVAGVTVDTGAEFRLRAYQTAAKDNLENFLDEEDFQEAFRSALEDLAQNTSSATDRELRVILDGASLLEIAPSEWADHAIDAGEELIIRAQSAFDPRQGGEIAERILPLFTAKVIYAKRRAIRIVCDAYLDWFGPSVSIQETLSTLLDELREQGEIGRDLAIALTDLGRISEALDGPQAARALFEESVAFERGLVEKHDTPGARRGLAVALTELGRITEALDGPQAAQPLSKESVAVYRGLVEEQNTPEVRRELAIVLTDLGKITEALDGPKAAQPLFKESAALKRGLVEEQSTPEARRNLAATLTELGRITEAVDAPQAAQPLCEESIAMFRRLAEEQNTPGARRDLAVALTELGRITEALDGPKAAQPLFKESATLARGLVEKHNTPSARRGLAIALTDLGWIAERLSGPEAAQPLLEESVALYRGLVEELNTPDARRGLAAALIQLGRITEADYWPRAAQALFTESVALYRGLVEEQNTPDARRDLAVALADLRRITEALDGPQAARSLIEEQAKLEINTSV